MNLLSLERDRRDLGVPLRHKIGRSLKTTTKNQTHHVTSVLIIECNVVYTNLMG